jgi:hypothetical protein
VKEKKEKRACMAYTVNLHNRVMVYLFEFRIHVIQWLFFHDLFMSEVVSNSLMEIFYGPVHLFERVCG